MLSKYNDKVCWMKNTEDPMNCTTHAWDAIFWSASSDNPSNKLEISGQRRVPGSCPLRFPGMHGILPSQHTSISSSSWTIETSPQATQPQAQYTQEDEKSPAGCTLLFYGWKLGRFPVWGRCVNRVASVTNSIHKFQENYYPALDKIVNKGNLWNYILHYAGQVYMSRTVKMQLLTQLFYYCTFPVQF